MGQGAQDLVSDKPATFKGGGTNNAGGIASADVSHFDLVQTMDELGGGTISGTPLTADPMLGPLQNNGGPTQTMALLPGSPAVDAGDSFGISTDQRGDPRPVDFSGVPNAAGGDGADIGAFELQQACTGQTDPTQACHALIVSLTGSGSGTVAGSGIACPQSCSDSYGASVTVTLTAAAATRSTFLGWSGACSGKGQCNIAMNTDRTVTASFTTPPSITSLTQSASLWREGSKLAQITAKRKQRPPVGTAFSFRLNEPATVTLTFARQGARHKVAGTVKLAARKGNNHVLFDGRLSRTKKLKPGSYGLKITATNDAHQSTASRSLSFTIVK